MTAIIPGSTKEECPICLGKYEENELDIDKKIQLACGHFFHTECYAGQVEFQEDKARRAGESNIVIKCSVCRAVNISRSKKSNPYSSEESFKRALDLVMKEYDNDDEVKEVFPYLHKICGKLLDKYKQASESSKSKLLASIEELKNQLDTLIEEELKPIVLAILQDEIFSPMLKPDFSHQSHSENYSENYSVETAQERFNLWVQKVKQPYSDALAEKISSCLHTLYPLLCKFSKSTNTNSYNLEEDLVIAHVRLLDDGKIIPWRLHSIASRILKAMFTGNLALRSIEEEAKRWRYKDLPDKIQNHGVLVSYLCKSFPILQVRISGEHLKHKTASIATLEKKRQQSSPLCESTASLLIGCAFLTVSSLVFTVLNKK